MSNTRTALVCLALMVAGCGSQPSHRPRASADAPAPTTADAKLRQRAHAVLETEAESASPALRANAVEGLVQEPALLAAAVEDALRDDNLGVRAVAAMAVGRARLIGAMPSVFPLLHDPSPRVRAAAIYAIDACGEEVDPTPLSGMLRSDNPLVRAQAATIIGLLGDPSALPMLEEAARDTMPRASVAEYRLLQLQLAAARARLGDDSALHEIRAALFPSRPEDLEATALAAQFIGEIEDRAYQHQLVNLIARLDEAGSRMPPEVRLAAAGSLANLGDPRGGFVAREYASHDRATVRAQAAYVLGRIGSTEGLGTLKQLLGDPDGQVRVAAAAAILAVLPAKPEGTTADASGL